MLKTARWVIIILMWLNFVVGMPLLAMLGWSFLAEGSFLAQLVRINSDGDIGTMLWSARGILLLVLPVMIFAHLLFRHLLDILATVEAGDPFTPINAERLSSVAGYLLLIQLCDIGFGIVGALFDTAAGERLSAWSPGLTGWIAVLLTFVLARVFREGARLRDDAELTI